MRVTPSPVIVHNRVMVINVPMEAARNMAAKTETADRQPAHADTGPRSPKNRPARVNSGMQRIKTGAVRMASARENHSVYTSKGRSNSYATLPVRIMLLMS